MNTPFFLLVKTPLAVFPLVSAHLRLCVLLHFREERKLFGSVQHRLLSACKCALFHSPDTGERPGGINTGELSAGCSVHWVLTVVEI